RDACLFGVGSPYRLRRAFGFDQRGEPALRVVDDDLAYLPERTLAYEVARLFHHGVPRVVVSERKDDVMLLRESTQLLRLLDGERHRLVANDVKARLDKRLGDRKVRVVGCDDGDKVDALVGR